MTLSPIRPISLTLNPYFDAKMWIPTSCILPLRGKAVMVFDQRRNSTYLARLMKCLDGQKIWVAAPPLPHISFVEDEHIIQWMSKEMYLERFRK